MIDPMANLDAGVPGASQGGEEKDIIDFMTLRYNLEKIEKMKSVTAIASGCVAGICGLTGLDGLGRVSFLGSFLEPRCSNCDEIHHYDHCFVSSDFSQTSMQFALLRFIS